MDKFGGYIYAGTTWCDMCIVNETHDTLNLEMGSILRSTEQILDGNARVRGIDREKPKSFSSDVFPKSAMIDHCNCCEGG